jgi:hypothetical protein
MRIVALDLGEIRFRVIPDAREELARVGQLDEVVVGACVECFDLERRLIRRREHDDRDIASHRARAVLAHEREPADAGHHEVLEDDRRLDPFCRLQRLLGFAAEVEADARRARERAAHSLTDDHLIVHEQYTRGVLDFSDALRSGRL